jgi:toxin ParE1/3/4
MIIQYRKQALDDIETIDGYLRERNASGALNVMREIAEAIRFVGMHPLAGPPTGKADIRVRIVRRYRYKVFYRIDADAVEIIHVRHMSRRPWDSI